MESGASLPAAVHDGRDARRSIRRRLSLPAPTARPATNGLRLLHRTVSTVWRVHWISPNSRIHEPAGVGVEAGAYFSDRAEPVWSRALQVFAPGAPPC